MNVDLSEYLPVTGYACDVGANNGKFNSNTDILEHHKNWVVLCIEPNPLLEADGRACRKLWRQIAAGAVDEDRTFYAIGGHPYASGSRIDYTNAGATSEHRVRQLRLDRILEEAGFPRLDYLTIDVEGWEEQVMNGFSQHLWKPKIIQIEHYSRPGFPANSDINNPMPVEGYDPIGVAGAEGFDVVYLRKEGA